MHRYGRHGPYAWLRRRKRHYARSPSRLPVPVKQSVAQPPQRPFILIERVIIIVTSQDFYEEDETKENLLPDTGKPLALPSAHTDLTRTTTFIAKRVLDVHPHMVQSYACIETAVSKLAFYGTFARARDLTDAEIKHIRDVYIAYFQGHSVRCSGSSEEDELVRTAVQDSRSHFNLEQCQIYALAGLRIGRLWNRAFPDIPTSLNYAQMYVNHFMHPEVEVLWELPQGVFP